MDPKELKTKINTESPVNKLLAVLASQDIMAAKEGGWNLVNAKVQIVTEEDAMEELETGDGAAVAGIFVSLDDDKVKFVFSLEGNFIGVSNWK